MPEISAAAFGVTITPTKATAVTLTGTATATAGDSSTLDVAALVSWPTITVEISFTATLDTEPSWTDITDDVQAVNCRTGRNYELDRTETGVCQALAENRERRYEPGYTLSPHYPNVTPGREIRVRATWLGATYDLWRGRVEEWPLDWGQAQDATVTVEAVDGFELLARGDITTTAPKEWTGQRIARILDAAGWPAEMRHLDLGQSYVLAQELEGENALTHILAAADTDLGIVYCDGAGKVRFIDRSTRAAPPAYTVQLGDDETSFAELPYVDAPLEYGLDRVYTEVAVTRQGGFEQRVADSAAQDASGRRVLSRTGLWTADVVSAQVAAFLLERHKEPRIRFTRVELDPVPDPMLWQAVLSTRVGDVVRVVRRPPGGGAPLSQDCWVEGIEHRFDMRREWRTIWQLTAAYTATVTIAPDGIDVPVNTSAPRMSGQTVVGEQLRITTLGRWYDESQGTITYAYRWQVATPTTFVDPDTGEEQTVPADGTIADVAGAAAYTYTIAATHEGKLIRAVVDGRNSAGLGTGYATWDGPVTLAPPPDTDEPPTTDDGGGGDTGGDTGGTHPFELDVDELDDPDALLG